MIHWQQSTLSDGWAGDGANLQTWQWILDWDWLDRWYLWSSTETRELDLWWIISIFQKFYLRFRRQPELKELNAAKTRTSAGLFKRPCRKKTKKKEAKRQRTKEATGRFLRVHCSRISCWLYWWWTCSSAGWRKWCCSASNKWSEFT